MLNWLCRRVLFSWGILHNPLKRKIVNLTNSKIGSEIYYKAGSKIYNTGYFELGDRCFVSRDCSFITGTDAFPDCQIIIGQDVAIGLETSFNCATHEIGSPKRRAGALKMASIIVAMVFGLARASRFSPGLQLDLDVLLVLGALSTRTVNLTVYTLAYQQD